MFECYIVIFFSPVHVNTYQTGVFNYDRINFKEILKHLIILYWYNFILGYVY